MMDVPQVARLKKAVNDNSQGRCQLKSLAKFGKVSINDRIVHTSCEGGASVRGDDYTNCMWGGGGGKEEVSVA